MLATVEDFVADSTDVGAVDVVLVRVTGQMVFSCKGLVALAALVDEQGTVQRHVPGQVVHTVERRLTNMARVHEGGCLELRSVYSFRFF